jgi:hypothetical protein
VINICDTPPLIHSPEVRDQGDREVRIAAADLSFAPKQNAQVVIGGKTYQVVSVNTCEPFSEAAIHIVQVQGGNG